MDEPVEFASEITLSKDEVLDLVARCEEVVGMAERADGVEIGFAVEGVRRFLLGRLLGEGGSLE